MSFLKKMLGQQESINRPQYASGYSPVRWPTTPSCRPPEKVEQIETEIVAWRGWMLAVDEDGLPILHSFNSTPWLGPTLTADKPPATSTEHGVYALGEFPAAISFNRGYFIQAAFGQVALSGLVIEGCYGYRAERATIRSLWLADATHYSVCENMCAWEMAGYLGQRYDVDVDIAGKRWRAWRDKALAETERERERLRYGVGFAR